MQFYEHCDHNTIAKAYRKDAIASGLLVTLKEKSIQQPSLDELIGACFLHKGIQTHVQPQSRFYDAKKPDRYESLTTFATCLLYTSIYVLDLHLIRCTEISLLILGIKDIASIVYDCKNRFFLEGASFFTIG